MSIFKEEFLDFIGEEYMTKGWVMGSIFLGLVSDRNGIGVVLALLAMGIVLASVGAIVTTIYRVLTNN